MFKSFKISETQLESLNLYAGWMCHPRFVPSATSSSRKDTCSVRPESKHKSSFRLFPTRRFLLSIQRTSDGESSSIKNVSLDHRCLKILVSEQFLHGADVVSLFKQVCCKRMPKRVAASILPRTDCGHCLLHRPLY